jgi:hypothetical protein
MKTLVAALALLSPAAGPLHNGYFYAAVQIWTSRTLNISLDRTRGDSHGYKKPRPPTRQQWQAGTAVGKTLSHFRTIEALISAI